MAIDRNKASTTLFNRTRTVKQEVKEVEKSKKKILKRPKISKKEVVLESTQYSEKMLKIVLERNLFIDGEFKQQGLSVELPYYEALRLDGIRFGKIRLN